MNELKIFQNSEFGELGVMIIDGKEYFPATQCAKILGYSNPQKAVRDHCDEEGGHETFSPHKQRNTGDEVYQRGKPLQTNRPFQASCGKEI